MAHKQFELNDTQKVTIYKRRTNRNLRLTVAPSGEIRVSIPLWAPYKAGLDFARKRQDWINSQQRPQLVLKDGQSVGKAHHLKVQATDTPKIRARVKSSEILVNFPEELSDSDPAVQEVAKKACIRALKQQAHALLPQRLADLAARYGFEYNSVIIKQLKSRWGSCDQHSNIVLNLYLMQLPWECIDYVIMHELTHTKVLHHGPIFWQEMEKSMPDVKNRRKLMLSYHPVLDSPLAPSL